MIAIELPAEVEKALAGFASEDGQSQEDLAVDALVEYVSERQALAIAEQRIRELEDGKSYTVPLEELMDRYGVER